MAAATETQRLITLSIGKIAQSRGKRGGINLHKNLLVATVLHKARTAYMMENYNYQITLQKQKTVDNTSACDSVESSTTFSSCEDRVDSPAEHKGNQLQRENSLDVDHEESVLPEPTREPVVTTTISDCAQSSDKENLPPCAHQSSTLVQEPCKQQSLSGDEHLAAANQLSQEVQHFASSENQQSSCAKQSGATTTCLSVLKRRRENRHSSQDTDSCSVSKMARVSIDVNPTFPPQFSDSCDDHGSDFEQDMQIDSPQINNLVNIFNSGFSGLCAASPAESLDSSSALSSHQWPNSTQSACFSRKMMSDPSLLCSSQVERLDTLQSAIILSA